MAMTRKYEGVKLVKKNYLFRKRRYRSFWEIRFNSK